MPFGMWAGVSHVDVKLLPRSFMERGTLGDILGHAQV